MPLPTISIIIHGRDDEYVNNFVEMLSFTVNFIAAGAYSQKIQNRIEIVLVDWGSVSSFIPKIFHSLKLPKSSIINGHYIDNESIKKLDGDSPYHISKAVNFGMKKAKGDYFLILSGNNIIPELHLLQLLSLIDNRDRLLPHVQEIYGILPRRALPHPVAGSFSREIINNYFKNISLTGFPCHFKINSGGGGAGLLFQKSLIEKVQGLSEESGMYGWNDAEIYYRLLQYTDVIDLGNFGLCGFKFWRNNASENISKRRLEFEKVRKRYPNYLKPERFQSNNNWGAQGLKSSVSFKYPLRTFEKLTGTPRDNTPKSILSNEITFLKISFLQIIKAYIRYRHAQKIAKKDAFYFSELMQIIDVINKTKTYQIVISTDCAQKLLYFLVSLLPGIDFTVIDDQLGSGDAETNFGNIAKRIKHFHYSRIKYIRGQSQIQDFFNEKDLKWMKDIQGLVIFNPEISYFQNSISNDNKTELFKTKKIKILNLGSSPREYKMNEEIDNKFSNLYKLHLKLGVEVISYFLCLLIFILQKLKSIMKRLLILVYKF